MNRSTQAEVDAIAATAVEFLEIQLANDLEGMVSFYAPDGVLMPPDQPAVHGTDDSRAWFAGVLDRFRIVAADVVHDELVVAGDWAFRRGSFDWTLRPRSGGDPVELKRKFLQVWQRQPDGAWKVARGMWNRNAPAS